MKSLSVISVALLTSSLSACGVQDPSSQMSDAKTVEQQNQQYAKAQPVPMFDYSLERDLLIQLYKIRNEEVATHSVWRSDYGIVEGDCPSLGYGLPYDTSLTNPWVAVNRAPGSTYYRNGLTTVGQQEPNGVFASTNTSATWVMCIGVTGAIEPVYVESKVTAYPGPVEVDYQTNRVTRIGEATVVLSYEGE